MTYEEGKVTGEYKVIRIRKEPLLVRQQKPTMYSVVNLTVNPNDQEKKVYFTFHKTGRTIQYVLISIRESAVLWRFIPPKEEEETETILDYFMLYDQDYIFDIETVGFVVKAVEGATMPAKINVVAFY